MSNKLVKNGLMGNCENCYYSTFDFEDNENIYYKCHRFPRFEDKRAFDYCGEYARVERNPFDFTE